MRHDDDDDGTLFSRWHVGSRLKLLECMRFGSYFEAVTTGMPQVGKSNFIND
jgi:hypothetical protein